MGNVEMGRLKIGTAVAGLLLIATACSGNDGDGAPATRSTGEGANASTEQVTALGGKVVSFGENFEFEDGLSITVGEPKEFVPSPSATTGGEGQYVKFTMQLANETNAKISLSEVFVTVESGGGQAGDVVDKKHKMSGPPSAKLKPGDEVAWSQGFGVLDPENVTVVVQAGMDRAPVAFNG
jgi:hypothetical protein